MPSYNPRFTLTPAIARDLAAIEAARTTLELLPLPLGVEKRLRREAHVRVAHNSTWIENRTLTLDEARRVIEDKHGKDPSRAAAQAAIELRNYWNALAFIDRNAKARLSDVLVRAIHTILLRGTRGAGRPRQLSRYRTTNLQVGRMEYLPPEHQDVPRLMAEFLAWLEAPDAARELPGPILAAVAAYQLVTIHPFDDGNGRTCRALATLLLKRTGYGMKGLASMESFYAEGLPRYYGSLQMGLHHNYYESNKAGSRSDPDLTPWIAYFVEMFARTASELKAVVEQEAREAGTLTIGQAFEQLPRPIRELLGELPDLQSTFTPTDVAGWFGVSTKTARLWLSRWMGEGHVEPAAKGMTRVRRYRITQRLQQGLGRAGMA